MHGGAAWFKFANSDGKSVELSSMAESPPFSRIGFDVGYPITLACAKPSD
jgi:hypothetical protein